MSEALFFHSYIFFIDYPSKTKDTIWYVKGQTSISFTLSCQTRLEFMLVLICPTLTASSGRIPVFEARTLVTSSTT